MSVRIMEVRMETIHFRVGITQGVLKKSDVTAPSLEMAEPESESYFSRVWTWAPCWPGQQR